MSASSRWNKYLVGIRNAAGSVFSSARLYLDFGSGFLVSLSTDGKGYRVDFDPASAASTSWKSFADGRTTSNQSLSISLPASIGSVSIDAAANPPQRFLLTAQSDAKQNGLYYYDAASSTLMRTSDASTEATLRALRVAVRRGDGAGEVWYLSNTGACVPGTDNLTMALTEQASDKATLDALVSCTWDNIVTASAAADSDIAFNAAILKDIGDPVDAQDAATKAYVDAVGGGADIDAAYLEDTDSAVNANGVPIRAMSTPLAFQCGDGLEAIVSSTTDASTTGVFNGLVVRRYADGGNGANGIGVGQAFRTHDDGGGDIDIGQITVTASVVASATATMGIRVAQAGSLPEVATLTGEGVLEVTGGFVGPYVDYGGAFAVGPTSSSVTIGSDEDAGAIDHRVATGGYSRWYVDNVLRATLSASAFTWGETVTTPTIGQTTRTTNAATTELRLTSQAPYASATGANRNAGSFRFTIPSPISGGAEGYYYFTLSGADVLRIGRPSGTFETEVRFSNSAIVVRPATVFGSTYDMFCGGVYASCDNFRLRNASQVTCGNFALGSTTLAFTADAACTAFTWGQTKRTGSGANAGTNAFVYSQDGQNVAAGTNNNGGALNLCSGAAGTGGTGGTVGDINLRTGGMSGTIQVGISDTRVACAVRVETPRVIAAYSTPVSATGALTINLATSQNAYHLTTEDTTVTITGGVDGQSGDIVFTQGATGRTITLPTSGSGVEYDAVILGLGLTAIVDTTVAVRTVLSYTVLPNGRAYIKARSVSAVIP